MLLLLKTNKIRFIIHIVNIVYSHSQQAAKRKETVANMPQWRKVRTSALKAYNYYKQLEDQYKEAEVQFNEVKAKLEKELADAGIKYDSIEQVLSKDFLKNN